MNFKIYMDIPTKTFQSKRWYCVYVKSKKKYMSKSYNDSEYESIIDEYTLRLRKYKPRIPLDTALKVTLYFVMKTKTQRKWGQYKPTGSDVDNMAKGVLDCMQKIGFYVNDSRIVDLRIIKRWGEEGSLAVQIEDAILAEEREYK